MKKNKFLVLAAVAVMFASCGGQQGKMGDDEYAVRTIETQSTELQTSYPATIRGVQDVEIRPMVSGFITKMYVKEGQTVRKGQVLFEINKVTYEAAARQAKAAVNSAEAQLNTSKLTYENNQKLFANNVIGSIKTSTNVDDTFVINFSKGSTGVDDGTYSLKSLNTLLPTITTSFGSPFLFNLAGSPTSSVFVTLTNENYYCSTKVSIPTYALKTIGVQTRVDVEGIYRVNFDATKTTLVVDQRFSSSLAFPNQNMVDLTFVLAFNDNYVYVGVDKFNDNSLAKIGGWTGVYETWDDSGYKFKVNTTNNSSSFIITGNQNAGSTTIATTSNISAIPITNSPPFEYRYFKTSLYFTAGNLTNFDAVASNTPKLYIFYGYTIDRVPSLADGVSIANVNITVYSSAIPSLPVP